jgi:hypothetical protein
MRKKFEDLMVYNIDIDMDKLDESGIQFISVVENPAIEVEGVFLSDDKVEETLDFKCFSDQMILCGPTMIPNKYIKRYDDIRGKHYVNFTADVIKKMVEKFMKGNNNTMINFEHSTKMVDAFIRDAFIIEDPIFNNSRKYGFKNLPVGTHFIVLKIDDKKFWNEEVKGNNKTSFSIEGLLKSIPVKYSIEELDQVEMASIPAHPDCQCQMVNGEWVTEPTACDYCNELADKHNRKSFSINDLDDNDIEELFRHTLNTLNKTI